MFGKKNRTQLLVRKKIFFYHTIRMTTQHLTAHSNSRIKTDVWEPITSWVFRESDWNFVCGTYPMATFHKSNLRQNASKLRELWQTGSGKNLLLAKPSAGVHTGVQKVQGHQQLAWFDRLIVRWVPYLRFNPFQFVYCLESRQFNWSRRTPAGKRSLWEAGGHWFESHPGPTFVRHNVGPVVVWKSRNQCTSCLLGGCYCRNCCGASLLANFWQCCGEGQVQVSVT